MSEGQEAFEKACKLLQRAKHHFEYTNTLAESYLKDDIKKFLEEHKPSSIPDGYSGDCPPHSPSSDDKPR